MTSDKELEAIYAKWADDRGWRYHDDVDGFLAFRAGMRLQAERSNRIALDFDTRGVPDYQIKLRIAAAIRAAAQGDV